MNIFSDVPNVADEFCEILAETNDLRIERIVSQGHRSIENFWYDQSEDEWLCLVSGSACLMFEDCSVILQKGDSMHIPAHLRHRVDDTSESPPCIWICVFWQYR